MSDLYERLSALSPEQRALFEARLKQQGLSVPKSPTIRRRKAAGAAPLSIDQEQLWVVDQINPGTAAYNVHTAMSLTGPLDHCALAQALNEIVRRHEALRTTFQAVDGRPAQLIAPRLSIAIAAEDVSALADAPREARRRAAEEVGHPFDLARGPLLRVRLMRTSPDEHVLVITMHHIIADSWSFGVFNQELWALYRAFSANQPSPLPELEIQYADFARWQREWLQGEVLEEKLAYWRRQLAAAPADLRLPTSRSRPAAPEFRGATRFATVAAATTRALKALAQRERATMFMTMLAAFDALLFRYSGQGDIIVGSPIANRNQPETEGLIGYFLNMLVLRTRVDGAMSFRQLLAEVRATSLGAFAHQDVPFAKLVHELQPERDMAQNPIFQVAFVYLDFQGEGVELEGLRMRPLRLDPGTSMFDLTLGLAEQDDCLEAFFEYSTDLFDPETVERMVGHFETLLEAITTNPSQPLSQLPLMGGAERQQILVEWGQAKAEYPIDRCLYQLFEAQVERAPDLPAIQFRDEQLSYGELNERANRLARHLARQGVGVETLVGVAFERSIEMIVAVLGVLKAGAAYLPLDPTYPRERLEYMLADSGAAILLTEQKLIQALPGRGAKLLCLDAGWDEIAQERGGNLASRATPDHLAYAIYTSGSTGKPKGVMIAHRGIVNRLLWDQHVYPMDEADSVLQINSLNFDISVLEIFPALCSGARLVLAEPEGQRDGSYLVKAISEHRITLINLVPSMLQALLDDSNLAECRTLRRVYCGGEVMTRQLKDRFLANLPATLVNLYGPTEATVDAAHWVCKPDPEHEVVPIGRPTGNLEIYLLDRYVEPVPARVAGELYIGGVGVARGYLNQPETTAEKFIPNRFSDLPGARLYRTGDGARWLPDGNIEFLGRSDNQVKIRGYRIELGEIEKVLAQHQATREAVVIVRTDAQGNKRLVAYVTAQPGATITAADLREHAKRELPEYMVPTWMVVMDRLPLMPNGKVDRNQLPAPETTGPRRNQSYVAPRNQAEQVLSQIWAELLGVERVGIHDNFFHLGGDSILSIQIVARARKAGLRLSARQLFEQQTIARLAAAGSPSIAGEQGAVTGEVPLTPIQHWFFEQEFPEPHHWNQSVLLESPQRLDPEVMQRVVAGILEHHDALRLRFYRDAGGWRQVGVEPGGETPFTYMDLSTLREADQRAMTEAKAGEAQSTLHLSEGPLMRVCLFDRGEARPCRLLIVIHHLVVDAISWRILLEDMQTAFRQASAGEPIRLGRKTTSFKEWAERLIEYARSAELRGELSHWHAVVSHEFMPLPVDYPDGTNVESSARSVSVALSEEDTRALLQQVPRAYGTQINDALLAALAQALGKWMAVPRALIEVEGHGREEIIAGLDLSRTVGWFTSTYPIELALEADARPSEVLKATKEKLRRIPDRGIGYGLLSYLSRDAESEPLRTRPRPQVSFNYLGQLDQSFGDSSTFELAEDDAGPIHSRNAMRSHLIEIEASIVGGRLQTVWGYSENLHRRETIETLATAYIASLALLVEHCLLDEATGFTPADFPEARLNQAELDKFLASITATNEEKRDGRA